MKKVSIIYWSNGRNVEVLADSIAEGAKCANANVNMKYVHDAIVEDVTEADAATSGSSSADNDRIEQHEMEPFISQFKLLPNKQKKIVLSGSYGWDDKEFVVDWVQHMSDYDSNVVGHITIKESSSEEELLKVKELGEKLTK